MLKEESPNDSISLLPFFQCDQQVFMYSIIQGYKD